MREQRGNVKLTKDDILNIRAAYHEGRTQRELCQLYHVSITTIGRVVRGETWQWLGEKGEGSAPYDGRPRGPGPLTQAQEQDAVLSADRLKALLAEGDKPAE